MLQIIEVFQVLASRYEDEQPGAPGNLENTTEIIRLSLQAADGYLNSVQKERYHDRMKTYHRNARLPVGTEGILLYRSNNYDKGYIRFLCLSSILKCVDFPEHFKILAIYALLKEGNGKILKSAVKDALVTSLGQNIESDIKLYLSRHYLNEDNLEKMREKLIELCRSINQDEYTYLPRISGNRISYNVARLYDLGSVIDIKNVRPPEDYSDISDHWTGYEITCNIL